MILTKEEIQLRKNKSRKIYTEEYDSNILTEHCKKFDFIGNKLSPSISGQYFLYETLTCGERNDGHKAILTYPKLGIYLDCYAADQTIEVEWFDTRRSWEYNIEYEIPLSDGRMYHNIAADMRTELKYIVLWSDSMMVYGLWNSKPDWKKLRQAYERTYWFHRSKSDIRDIQLDRLLNGL